MTTLREASHPFVVALAALATAAETGDEAAFTRLFSTDATIWQSTVGHGMRVPDLVRVLRALDRTVGGRRYLDRRVDVLERGAVEQHVLEGTRLSDGARVRLTACVVVRFDEDGLICDLREYLDSAETAAFTAPPTSLRS